MAFLIIDTIYRLFIFLLLARVIISWVRLDPYNPIVPFIYDITEPILAPIRNLIPGSMMMDFSPMVAWIIAFALRQLLITLLA